MTADTGKLDPRLDIERIRSAVRVETAIQMRSHLVQRAWLLSNIEPLDARAAATVEARINEIDQLLQACELP